MEEESDSDSDSIEYIDLNHSSDDQYSSESNDDSNDDSNNDSNNDNNDNNNINLNINFNNFNNDLLSLLNPQFFFQFQDHPTSQNLHLSQPTNLVLNRNTPHFISPHRFSSTPQSQSFLPNSNRPIRPKTPAEQYESDLQKAIELSLTDESPPKKPENVELSGFEKDIDTALKESEKEAQAAEKFAEIIHNETKLKKILSTLSPIVDINDPRFKQFYQDHK